MSTLAYATFTRTRLDAPPGKSTKPDGSPGVKTYVDALAALVPAEVLALHATILTFTTKTENATVTITNGRALAIAFYALIVLSVLIYAGGRLMAKQWEAWDYLRTLIPPAAFVGWAMLQKATAFDAVAGSALDEATHSVIPLVGGIILGLGAAALAYKADAKSPSKS